MKHSCTTAVGLTLVLLSGCSSSHSTSYGRFYRCDYNSGAVYLTTTPCGVEEPQRNYIRPTSWGVAGGGFRAYADTTYHRPVFYLVSGNYDIDNADSLFQVENLTPLPSASREHRLSGARSLVRVSTP